MQSINVSVVNPWFMIAFFGPAALCCVLIVSTSLRGNATGASFILAGSALYLLGTMAVTFTFNVPLNDALANVDPTSVDGASQWKNYLTIWTSWNHVRMIAALLATASFMVAFAMVSPVSAIVREP